MAEQAASVDLLSAEAVGSITSADDLNQALAEGDAAERALAAIEGLFRPDDTIELRAFGPNIRGADCYCGRLDDAEQRHGLLDFIERHNGRNNLYVGANPRHAALAGAARSGAAAHISVRRTVYLDLDYKDAPVKDPDWSQTIAALADRSSCYGVVHTGNGAQVWLALAETAPDDTAAHGDVVAAMARLGADGTADVARVGRLPFTVNVPTEPKRRRGNTMCLALPYESYPLGAGREPVKPQRETAADLLSACTEIADRLAIPGRRLAGERDGAPRPQSASAGTRPRGAAEQDDDGVPPDVAAMQAAIGDADSRRRKTSEVAAPSEELLRMAVSELPNDGPFDFDRNGWAGVAHAIRNAARNGNYEEAGREMWLDFCSRWHWVGDPYEDERVWSTLSGSTGGYSTIKRLLETHNPAGLERVMLAEARHYFRSGAGLQGRSGAGASFQIDPSPVPPRAWLMRPVLLRGFLSLLVAPGGTGKSALTMLEAVSLASGKTLLPDRVPHRRLTVWLHNAEDPGDEQRRRLLATLKAHGVHISDVLDRLFLTSGRTHPIRLAHPGLNGAELVPGAIEILVEECRARRVDVLMLDPLGAMHSLDENSNDAINVLLGGLRELAERADMAVLLVHHTSKHAASNMQEAGAGASRGASALTDGVRNVRQLARLARSNAAEFGVSPDDAWKYVAIKNGKGNLAPLASDLWFELASVDLNNGTPEYPDGDTVGVAMPWEPLALRGTWATALNAAMVQSAMERLPADRRRADSKARGWIGYEVAELLGLGIGSVDLPLRARPAEHMRNRTIILECLAEWTRQGWLIQIGEQCADRKERPCFRAGDAVPEEDRPETMPGPGAEVADA